MVVIDPAQYLRRIRSDAFVRSVFIWKVGKRKKKFLLKVRLVALLVYLCKNKKRKINGNKKNKHY